MLIASSVSGNVRDNPEYKPGNFDRLRLSRLELERSRLRRRTEDGTDIGIALPPGVILRHGDILETGGRPVIVEQRPESVIAARPGRAAPVGVLALVGHAIGSRHRPVRVNGKTVYFPVQAESELEAFGEIFSRLGDVTVSMENMIFVPDVGGEDLGHA